MSLLNGTDKITYAISGSYLNQEGIIKGTDYNRYTLRINSTSNVKKWLTVGENIGFSHSTYNIVPEQNEWTSVVIQALTIDPITPVHNEDGTASGAFNNIGNPVGAIERNHNELKNNQLLGTAYMEIAPVKWLVFRSNIGVEMNSSKIPFYACF
ncbi:MAG: hypothetical protein HC906_08350 [Bacteroidales bacterium]|nr:hypothetical protein [Bacteroidales bacterium]